VEGEVGNEQSSGSDLLGNPKLFANGLVVRNPIL